MFWRAVKDFADEHEGEDTNVFLWSSYKFFSTVLSNPTKFGFGKDDPSKKYGAIWADHVHPTTEMHRHICVALVDFLKSQKTLDAKEGGGEGPSES